LPGGWPTAAHLYISLISSVGEQLTSAQPELTQKTRELAEIDCKLFACVAQNTGIQDIHSGNYPPDYRLSAGHGATMRTFSFVLSFMVLAVLTIIAPTEARADTVSTFDFSGTLADSTDGSNSVTGQFTLDNTTKTILAFEFTTPSSSIVATDDPSTNYTPLVLEVTQFDSPFNTYVDLAFYNSSPSSVHMFLWFQTSLTDFTATTPLLVGAEPSDAGIQPGNELAAGPSQLICLTGPPMSDCSPEGQSIFTSGTATVVAVTTPEPTFLPQLGIGLIGLLAPLLRKRLMTNDHPAR
jgi:hypothetical protein